ncbi:M61 family metallopeptidase [Ideonella azotifigens]|uniref:M61 family metallopeptidase n=2 Tax=Ideonella azotifigens TaxID=513160 RepID=UPI001E3530B9|nr:peptidase M61 [Ideonella azotifigens]
MQLPKTLSADMRAARAPIRGWLVTGLCLGAISALMTSPAMGAPPPPPPPPSLPATVLAPAAPDVQTWPGTIALEVDATDLAHRLLKVSQRLPIAPAAQGGPLTLYYARFLPGAHGPYGDVARLAGLTVLAGDRRLPWQRDVTDPFAFHLNVPAGVSELQLAFQYTAPVKHGGDRISITREMLGVEWETVLLYPAGPAAAAIRVKPRLRLPVGWQPATALRSPAGQPARAGEDGWVDYAEVGLETLVDSPLFAGRYTKRIELDPPGTPHAVALNLLADEPGQLVATAAQLAAHKALVQQADKLFGHRPYRQYDFLLALSDEFGGIGLEHHESSENGLEADYFSDWDKAIRGRELLPHEYVHAWNGKFRRPADLWTPHYNTPMRNSLLWVYEGLTQYWGHVLAARSGLSTPEQARDRLAAVAADAQARSGRVWRSLQDTTNEATLGPGHTAEWEDWQRSSDYYDEGLLLWLDADTLIREKSGGKKSLDDFARSFFGRTPQQRADGSIQPLTYTFDELVTALNALQPHDWAGFWRERLNRTGTVAPLDGVSHAGWQLRWRTEESRFSAQERGWSGPEGDERPQDMAYSLGLRVTSDGKLDQVYWDSPAFQAGLAAGMQVLAVNERSYRPERLTAAVTANIDGKAPIQLLVKDGDHFFSARIDWRGGLRYPALERVSATPDRLDAIYKAK